MTNGGTIPDRGLYGVFLVGERGPGARVGELDEEMVFESRVGETFLLGASTWRIEQITHDRVLVSPAPGEPGKMPFWKADSIGRPLELGRAVGALVRTLVAMPPAAAIERLVDQHDLDAQAAENLLRYLADQIAAAGVVPDDRTVLIERCRDELGDWRVCVLSPFGSRIHAPWAMAVVERVRAEAGLDVETMWTDDGFVVRFPETDDPPDPRLMLPPSEEVEALVLNQLGGTAMFAAKFREAAGRALLLPKRRPAGARPLWQLRKRPPTCSRRVPLRVVSRSSSRRIASACGTCSTCRRSSRRSADGAPGDPRGDRGLDRVPHRSPPRCSSATSPTTSTTAMRRSPSGARRRCRSIRHSCASCSARSELRELLDADRMAEVEAELQHLHEDRRATDRRRRARSPASARRFVAR